MCLKHFSFITLLSLLICSFSAEIHSSAAKPPATASAPRPYFYVSADEEDEGGEEAEEDDSFYGSFDRAADEFMGRYEKALLKSAQKSPHSEKLRASSPRFTHPAGGSPGSSSPLLGITKPAHESEKLPLGFILTTIINKYVSSPKDIENRMPYDVIEIKKSYSDSEEILAACKALFEKYDHKKRFLKCEIVRQVIKAVHSLK